MIDTLYQDAINRNLDDQVQRPARVMQPQLGAFANFWRGLGGIPAGASNLSGNVSDLAWADAQVLTATGTMTGQGMFNLPTAEEKRQADAMAAKLKKDGPDANTELGDTFRTVAKDYMPDAKTTGTAGLILGQGSSFLTQAVPLMAAGGPVPGAVLVGTTQGMQEADRLQEQGVDQEARMKAATVAGVGTGAAMLLPMSGPSALVRFGKGAAGGAGSYAAQTEAEKLVLQHAGYDKIASQYDPLDPTALLLSGAVPGLLGAGLGHGSKPDVRMPDGIIPDKSAAAADLRVDNDIAAVQRELARKGNTAEQNQILRDELEKLQAQKQAEPIKSAIEANPDLEAAARVQQTARAADASRLTPDGDLVGLEQHQQALDQALDQMGRGEPVQVSDVLAPTTENLSPIERQVVELVRNRGDLDVAATEAALPPVAPDHVRLYRAESPTFGFADVFDPEGLAAYRRPDIAGARYTDSLKVADYYRHSYNENRDAAIHYIDVPRDVAERGRIADDEFKVDLPTINRMRMAEAGRARDAGIEPPMQEMAAPETQERAQKSTAEPAAAEGNVKEPVGTTATPRASEPQERSPAGGSATSGNDRLDAAVAALDPDMLVHLDGMENAVRLGDLMESLRAEAAATERDASLIEVAAQCALSFPSA